MLFVSFDIDHSNKKKPNKTQQAVELITGGYQKDAEINK